jgi:peroxiredoxin
LRDIVDPLRELGASLVAITPLVSEHSRGLIEKHGLTFEMLSDPGNAYAAELGLRFELPKELREIYTSFGIDLEKSNGDASGTLPMPARIVVDAGGIVRTVDADPDYTRRPEPSKTLEDVRALG